MLPKICTLNLLLFIIPHLQTTQALAALPAPVNLRASAEATSISLTWEQPIGADTVDGYEIIYNYTVHECRAESDSRGNSSTVNVTLSGSLTNYTILNSSATPVEEDSTYTILLTAASWSTGKSSEAATVTVTTYTAVPSGPPQSLRVVSTAVSNITIEWDEVSCSERNGPIGNYTITVTGPYYWTPTEELLQYTTSRVYMVLDLHPRSTYTLTVRAANSDNLNHPGPPAWLSANTAIPLDLGFLFLGHLYGNNSIVNIEEIGEGSSSLLCLTDNIQCCFPYELRMFNITYPHWYFPNGSEIAFRKSGIYESFYRNRGPSVVRLHRRHNATVPNGVFHCTMPDINRTNQTLYIGVYSLRNGSPSIISLLVHRNTSTALICTSTGGPPTTVTWRRNGVLVDAKSLYWQTQIVLDPISAMYENILDTDNISNFIGTFTCEVSNVRGAALGTLPISKVSAPSVTIIIPSGSYYIGLTNLTLTCIASITNSASTDIDVRPEDLDITWIRGGTALSHNNSQVTISNTRGSKLQFTSNLTLSPLSHVDTVFMCKARVIPHRRTNFITNSEVGQFAKTIIIQFAALLMPPMIEQLSPLTFQVSWDPPQGAGSSESSITYNISCQSVKRGIDSPPLIAPEPGQTIAPVGSLAYGVIYNCSIIAQLSQIISQPAYFSIATMEIEPSSPPQEYTATNILSRAVQFSWHLPAVTEQNGVITNYTLACSPKVSGVAPIIETYTSAGSHIQGGFRPSTEYNCTVFASNSAGHSPKATIITFITQDESTFFQVRLNGLDSCPQWVGDRTGEKAEDIKLSLINAIQRHCQCGFTHDRVIGGVFKCFLDFPQSAIYRAVLHGTANATITELISHIEQWTAKEPTVTVQRVLLTIDGSCSVEISSLTDKEECPSPAFQEGSQNPSSLDNTEIITIGGLVSLVVVIIIAATVIVTLILLRKQCCAAVKLQNNRAPEQQAVEESELNAKEDEHKTGKAVQHTADHDYEMLESYNQNLMYDEVRCADIQSSGNYKLTQCPAYVPVATSQLEMVEECNS